MGGQWSYTFCFRHATSRICSKQHVENLGSYYLAFLCVSLKSRECSHSVKLTLLHFERNPSFFIREIRFTYDRKPFNIRQCCVYDDIAFNGLDIVADVCKLVSEFQMLATKSRDGYFFFKAHELFYLHSRRSQMFLATLEKLCSRDAAWAGIFVGNSRSFS